MYKITLEKQDVQICQPKNIKWNISQNKRRETNPELREK